METIDHPTEWKSLVELMTYVEREARNRLAQRGGVLHGGAEGAKVPN